MRWSNRVMLRLLIENSLDREEIMMAEWKNYTLSEMVTIKYGKNQKKVASENGTVPIYGTGGLMGYATEALYSQPSVLIGRKGTIGKS